jgi:translocation and assembly module TamA
VKCTSGSHAWFGSLVLLLAGCANGLPPEVRRVESVTFSGVRSVDETKLENGLYHRGPSGILSKTYTAFDPLSLELDRRRVQVFYQENGFLEAQVESQVAAVGTQTSTIGGTVVIRFDIREGPPSLIRRVLLTGVPDGDFVEAQDFEALRGRIFRYDKTKKLEAALQTAVRDAGYARAKVRAELVVDEAGRTVDVLVDVDAGPVAYIGSTTIRGLEELPESFVRNRLDFEEGDRYSLRAVERSRIRLMQSRLLQKANFSMVDHPELPRVDVVVDVNEDSKNELRLGGGVGFQNANYSFRLRLGYVRRGLFDPLLTLEAEARPSYNVFPDTPSANRPNIEATVSLHRDDFLIPRMRGSLQGRFDDVQYEAYSTRGPSLGGFFERSVFDDRLSLSGGASFSGFAVTDRLDPTLSDDEARNLGIVDPLEYVTLGGEVRYDRRDDPLESRSGWFVRARIDGGFIVSDNLSDYMRGALEGRGFLPIGKRLVLAARVRFESRLLGEALPITERAFAGGPESQRGFGRRRLAPQVRKEDGSSVPVGGNIRFETSFEGRFVVAKVLGQELALAAFADGADVTEEISQLELTNLHWALGAGLRIRTPAGPIRFDFGHRINRLGPTEPDANSPWAFHFSLGEAF